LLHGYTESVLAGEEKKKTGTEGGDSVPGMGGDGWEEWGIQDKPFVAVLYADTARLSKTGPYRTGFA